MPNTTTSTALVRYCPGDAIGTPASMPLNQALDQLEKDAAYLERMKEAGSDFSLYPHIIRGRNAYYCPKCSHS